MKPQSVAHLFFEACDKYNKPNAVLVKENGEFTPHSHKFYRQRVINFGRGLMSLGVRPRENVAILAETCFEWAITDFAIMGAGAVVVPIYPTISAEQVAWILNDSHAAGVIVSNLAQAKKIMSVRSKIPLLRFVIVMEDKAPEGMHSMKEIEMKGTQEDNENEFESRWQSLKGNDLLTIIYTSGTTGNPKGVMLSNDNILSNIMSLLPMMPFTSEDTHLSHLPLSHVLERMGGQYCMIFCGVTIAYAEDVSTVADDLMTVKPTVLMSVPRLFEKIYAKIMTGARQSGFAKRMIFNWALSVGRDAMPYFCKNQPLSGLLEKKYNIADKLVFSKVRERTGGRLKYMVSGGAPLAQEVAELFLMMNLKISEGYGLTETSPVLCIGPLDHLKPGSVGPAVKDVELKLASDGEIIVRGPNIMQGYWNNEAATAACMEGGWFHTGDIGTIDDDGYVWITDRKKDLIITSGGKNIAPQPLENALKLSPFIEQAVIIGDNRRFISALIVPPWETINDWAPGQGWTTNVAELVNNEEFLSMIQQEIDLKMKDFAHSEKVKKFAVIPKTFTVASGELTPSMKIRRRVIGEMYENEIEGMYS